MTQIRSPATRAKERLSACGALAPGEEISGAVEAVSFDDTLGELHKVFGEGLSKDQTIPVSSLEMYEVIATSGKGSGRIGRPL